LRGELVIFGQAALDREKTDERVDGLLHVENVEAAVPSRNLGLLLRVRTRATRLFRPLMRPDRADRRSD
jgi:hypothetical protein